MKCTKNNFLVPVYEYLHLALDAESEFSGSTTVRLKSTYNQLKTTKS